MTLELAKHQDFPSIQSTQISIRVMSKIQENFASEKVTSLKIEANSVEPYAFFHQKNKVLVTRELLSKVKATSENAMDFADSHKTKGKSAIACIGTMQSMVDFSSLCINMDTIITAICYNDEPQLILHHILLNFVAIVNNPDQCLCFIGTVTVSSSKSSTALPTLPLILGMAISCPKLARSPSSTRVH
jgi:hypothetical protein